MGPSRASRFASGGAASGTAKGYGRHKQLTAVKACRTVKKTDMLHNEYLPVMQIDAQTYEARADGQLLTCEPATVLPTAQRYFQF
jgi:urease subunit alpha